MTDHSYEYGYEQGYLEGERKGTKDGYLKALSMIRLEIEQERRDDFDKGYNVGLDTIAGHIDAHLWELQNDT
jgi:hypothetical protein